MMNEDAVYLDNLTTNQSFTTLMDFGNALASELRLKILHFVHRVGKTCFCELESLFKVKKSTLNYHIKLLSTPGLVKTYKNGKIIIIELGPNFDTLIPENLRVSFDKTK